MKKRLLRPCDPGPAGSLRKPGLWFQNGEWRTGENEAGHSSVIVASEHDPQKWKPLLRQDHAQAIDLARVLFDQVIPPGRNARECHSGLLNETPDQAWLTRRRIAAIDQLVFTVSESGLGICTGLCNPQNVMRSEQSSAANQTTPTRPRRRTRNRP